MILIDLSCNYGKCVALSGIRDIVRIGRHYMTGQITCSHVINNIICCSFGLIPGDRISAGRAGILQTGDIFYTDHEIIELGTKEFFSFALIVRWFTPFLSVMLYDVPVASGVSLAHLPVVWS